ncbi:MAG: thiamine pyrophosphate-dependent enzyme [Proteobacteria bacterium]|nr:thiamine pyrophosphate-dependent enzyme [Pseudomonadota bacterium]
MKDVNMEVMIGNYSIARGLVEAGLELAAAYPGTPSSEIIPGIIEFNKREHGHIHAEWSTNERCALEVAFGAASIGRKAACMMKQVGLNVAFPSFLGARRKKIKGGLVIICCDDPGPQSSQTEQDTRLIATLLNIPVLDPSSAKEAGDVAYYAMEYSYEHKVPVIVRSTHRVSHARENITLYQIGTRKVALNEGIGEAGVKGSRGQGVKGKRENGGHPNHSITQSLNHSSASSYPLSAKFGIVASGMSFSIAMDVIFELNLTQRIPIYKVIKVNPVDPDIYDFVDNAGRVLVLEETDSVLEAMIHRGNKVFGRRNGYVPGAGELTYDIIRGIIEQIVEEMGMEERTFFPDYSIEEALKEIRFPPRPPRLCAGCPHRASFFAMRYASPEAIFPGDIGCYTLGISMGAVDTCIDMGGGVNLASGFYNACNQDETFTPIIASIGDSTFFHAGLEPLYDATKTGKRFILVIMDNSTTAMTGMQPTPQTGMTADGVKTHSIKIEDMVRGFGIDFLKIIDPYSIPLMVETIREAHAYLVLDNHSAHKPAVIIARRECLLSAKGKHEALLDTINIEQDCIGCKSCIKLFDCPALIFNDEKRKVTVDEGLCTRCGMCLLVCAMKRPRKGQNK